MNFLVIKLLSVILYNFNVGSRDHIKRIKLISFIFCVNDNTKYLKALHNYIAT